MLRRGLWLLCSMQFMICPFPRLSSVPSGQYLGGIGWGRGWSAGCKAGGGSRGRGRQESARGFWIRVEVTRNSETLLRCPVAAQTRGEKGRSNSCQDSLVLKMLRTNGQNPRCQDWVTKIQSSGVGRLKLGLG